MTEANLSSNPRKVLLATDLSARCDRAFDRATALCEAWGSGLVVAHAVEPDARGASVPRREVPSWRRAAHKALLIAQRQVREDLQGSNTPLEVYIEESEPVEFILRVVQEGPCDLIVTGTARSETLGRVLLGTTVEKLARQSPVPILVVKTRPRHPYKTVLVGTDFSDASRAALVATAGLFPDAAITLLHCARPVLGGMRDRTQASGAMQLAQRDFQEFFKTIPSELHRRVEILTEERPLEEVVDAFFADRGLDLLVLGSKARGAVVHALLGSTADRLLSSARCDVLVVPGAVQAVQT